MEYNVEMIRALTKRWLAGETTLAEEAALKEFFGGAYGVLNELPADLQPYRHLFGQSAEVAAARPGRKLVLHTEVAATAAADLATQNTPGTALGTPQRRFLSRRARMTGWWTGIAAAAVVAAIVIFAPGRGRNDGNDGIGGIGEGGDIMCVVNGVQITDPDQIALYTRQALEIASDNLQKPRQAISSQLKDDPGLARAGELLNQLIETE